MNQTISCIRVNVDEKVISDGMDMIKKEDNVLKEKAKFFLLLGNEVRIKIVRLVLEFGRMCVCDLADVLRMKQSPVSQHLRKLKDGGILISKREGMTVFYMISPAVIDEIKKCIKEK